MRPGVPSYLSTAQMLRTARRGPLRRTQFGCRSRFKRDDHLLDLVTCAAFAARPRERGSHRKRCGHELDLLSPFQPKTFLDAAVAVTPACALDQEIVDPFRNKSVRHRYTNMRLAPDQQIRGQTRRGQRQNSCSPRRRRPTIRLRMLSFAAVGWYSPLTALFVCCSHWRVHPRSLNFLCQKNPAWRDAKDRFAN